MALIALTHTLTARSFYSYTEPGCFEVRPTVTPLGANANEAREASAERMPRDVADLWGFIVGLDDGKRTTLLAHCAARTVNALRLPWDRKPRSLQTAGRLWVLCCAASAAYRSSRRPVNSCDGLRSCRRASSQMLPQSAICATSASFSSTAKLRRRPSPVRTSNRRIGSELARCLDPGIAPSGASSSITMDSQPLLTPARWSGHIANDHSVNLCRQAAARTTHATGSVIFFLAFAACW